MNYQFFARRHELVGILVRLARRHRFWLAAQRTAGDLNPLDLKQLESAGTAVLEGYDRIFIAMNPPVSEQLRTATIVPAKYGWLQLDLPREVGSQLFLADFAMKSDWYDKSSKELETNNELPKLYRKLRADFRKEFTSPVWAVNMKTGGISAYSDMGISKLASQWESDGGELRQEGVDNVRFSGNEIRAQSIHRSID